MQTQQQLTDEQIAYLRTQPLGRLATVRPDGSPQNNPVGFVYNADLGTIDVGGLRMGETKKFRNIETEPRVAFVVDDVVATEQWQARFVEIRGVAEALRNQAPLRPGFSAELIRIKPERVLTYGI
jgi:pyridoxamine 5'-phosphate oxidase family protein